MDENNVKAAVTKGYGEASRQSAIGVLKAEYSRTQYRLEALGILIDILNKTPMKDGTDERLWALFVSKGW